ncbi:MULTISPECIES: NAD(P)-dependent oxidoreductase [unclassified Pseudomonas]|uniref:SDR family oxidoreductase n=1 Tax=unclassified Pseudomonas TaxID=196821 RepID=UPI000C86D020|nr:MULTISPECIES: NAD(P)-dependent oxidoreductase [unclassified Pseudomonas]PMV89291.1 short chain dehydrogenase [Pseudomonas sp. GW101-1A09]PMV92338.1 short chain dehydrogenase [Pseudomonas sp. FW306-2-2C-B10A]PMV93895.1 short chain dehydrogenase [Pseudomonas sp. GW460-C8]PMW08029.1 short chain dehydrogenase [Pseudomonas sp. MPR-TSA4]PMW14003.1 short chain dehydrogenase [Pseudomonas sp. GW456-E6]
MSLQGKTLFITGASRGIGREIALRAARDGANIVIAAKSADLHPKLPGTIFSVAKEVEDAGGKALALQVDVRDELAVREALAQAHEHFGGIDALINNAGAIKLTGVQHIELKRFDLMHQINTRAVLLCSQAALPYLKKTKGHILNLSPPLNLATKWFAQYSPYTVTKYGMSMLTLGMSEEFASYGISVNSLWPQTMIATAAIEFQLGSRESFKHARTPAIMADAAYAILDSSGRSITGRLLIDEEILSEHGVTDFEQYRFAPDTTDPLMPDLFVD